MCCFGWEYGGGGGCVLSGEDHLWSMGMVVAGVGIAANDRASAKRVHERRSSKVVRGKLRPRKGPRDMS